MPRLAIVAACERCIIDTDGNATLVNVFSALDVASLTGDVIPENAISPRAWAIYAQWDTLDDIGKTFTEQVRVVAPGGTEFGRTQEEFTANSASHGVRTAVPSMPVGKPGDVLIRIWLEANGKKVGQEHTYTVHLMHSGKR